MRDRRKMFYERKLRRQGWKTRHTVFLSYNGRENP